MRGQRIQGEVHLGADALELQAADVLHQVVRQLARVHQLQEGAPRVEGADHHVGRDLGPVRQRHAGRLAVAGQHPLDRRLEPDLGAERLRRAGQHLGEAAVAALVERPRPELAVVLAQGVEEQDQPAALRTRADLGADDRRRGQVSLEQRRLEVVVQEVGGAAGQQPHRVVQRPLVQAAQPRADGRQRQQLLRIVAERVRRHGVEQGLDGLADAVQVVAVLLVGIGVVRRDAGDLAQRLVVVAVEAQVLAVVAGCEAGRHQQRQEAVLRQLQLLDDLRPQQGQRVAEGGEPVARDAAPR